MSWKLVEPAAAPDRMSQFSLSDLGTKLLAAADLSNAQISELLSPEGDLTTSQADCIQACVKRLLLARQNGEKVFVGGDYDADGVCATAIMKRLLDRLGIENGYYIPNRMKEGYGLSVPTVEAAAQKSYAVLMTVDNGVKAQAALLRAKELGMFVIVTDHHVIEEDVPCDILVHPTRMEPAYSGLCGAGVAMEIARAMLGNDDVSTALAAVACIGDVMPLWAQTRVIVKKGLTLLQRGIPKSICSLFAPHTQIDDTAVAFQIVPKLNCVGRMADISNVNTVPRFLLSEDDGDIARYAAQLNALNEQRKELSAKETALASRLVGRERIAIVCDERFHEGICGLTAGHLADVFHKPVLVFCRVGDIYKGSGRSVPGFDFFSFLAEFPDWQLFGGHAMAVGASIASDHFAQLQEFVKQKAETIAEFPDETKTAVLVQTGELTVQAVRDLERLRPLPAELKEISFAVPGGSFQRVMSTAKVSKYKAGDLEAVLFAAKHKNWPPRASYVIGKPSLRTFRNSTSVQLTVEDVL